MDPRPLPGQPADLRQRDKEFYIRLIAAAFAHNGNLEQARGRLDSLAEPDINGLLAGLTERYIIEDRDVRDIIALVKLSDALGQTSVPMLAFLATPTSKPTAPPPPRRPPPPLALPAPPPPESRRRRNLAQLTPLRPGQP
ncbi:MAG: hypothetical protein U0401_33800 [Anaerolineae bacterium]